MPAQLDTGADRTVLPKAIVEQLGLKRTGEIRLSGLGGHLISLSTYIVELEPRMLPPRLVEIVANEDEPFVLLGRDVLNHFRSVFDGPNLALEIG